MVTRQTSAKAICTNKNTSYAAMRMDLIDSGINSTIDTVAYKQNDISAKQDGLIGSAKDPLSNRNTNTLWQDF
jgi:hypothetical protein